MNNYLLFSALLAAATGGIAQAEEPPATEIGCAVEGIEWQAVRLEGAEPNPERPPTLRFDEAEKRAAGFAGCNRFTGSYTLDDEALKFGPVAATKMACPPDQEAVERAFLSALAAATGLRVGETKLQLLAGEKVVAEFRAP